MAQGPIQLGQRPDHGARLTQTEYERRIVALHASGPAMPSKSEDVRARRAELDLLIDYRLGVEFPRHRRDSLWEEQRKLDRRLPWRFVASFVTHPLTPSGGLAKSQIRAYARHLSQPELSALLDLSPEEVARLS